MADQPPDKKMGDQCVIPMEEEVMEGINGVEDDEIEDPPPPYQEVEMGEEVEETEQDVQRILEEMISNQRLILQLSAPKTSGEGGGNGGEGGEVNQGNAMISYRRRLIEINFRRTAQTIIWVVTQYLAITIYCSIFAFISITNPRFAYYVEQCGEPLLLVSMACFCISLMVEHFPLIQIQFYSNLFSGLFLAGISMYFAVFPPFGLFQCTVLLSLLTATAIYSTVFMLTKCTGGIAELRGGGSGGNLAGETGGNMAAGGTRCGRHHHHHHHHHRRHHHHYRRHHHPACPRNLEQQQLGGNSGGFGVGMYVYGLCVVPTTLFVMSQILYFLYVGFQFDLSYGEYTGNVLSGIGAAVMICYERFRFLYYLLKAERVYFAKLDRVMMAVVK